MSRAVPENVYDQLAKMIDRVIAEKPKDAFGITEVLSRLVKQSPEGDAKVASALDAEALSSYVKKMQDLDKAPAEEGAVIPVCGMPNFVEEAEMLAWAGTGFGEAESYKIMCSMRNLAAKNKEGGLVKLRFWGKILGTEADYWVAEAQQDGGGEAEGEEADPDMEPAGTGANQYSYYVTTDLSGDWHRLPHIKPREIIAARTIKHLMSGKPKAKVITHPYFDGKEEVLLRAQIARITADTVLCMKGYLKKEEEEDAPIEENAEFLCPHVHELLKKQAWTHMQPHILKNGRTTYKEITDDDDEGTQAAKRKLEEAADPVKAVLRDLTSDGLEWSLKLSGDSTLCKDATSGKLKSSAVASVRSLTWPGAVCVVQSGHFANIYVGYGLRAGDPDFFLCAPPDVQDEPEDRGDQPEPQGTIEAPVEDA